MNSILGLLTCSFSTTKIGMERSAGSALALVDIRFYLDVLSPSCPTQPATGCLCQREVAGLYYRRYVQI
jgi:hypothetical protein